jgi:hypothetical protein
VLQHVGRRLEAVRDAYLALEAEETNEGLKINDKGQNTCMIAAGNRTIFDAEQTVAVGDQSFKVVNKFVD